jgi:hypothetical protein
MDPCFSKALCLGLYSTLCLSDIENLAIFSKRLAEFALKSRKKQIKIKIKIVKKNTESVSSKN